MLVVKAPVMVEAYRLFRDPVKNTERYPTWLNNAFIDGSVHLSDAYSDHIGCIRTLEGIMRINDGDYIIRGVDNELYPCKPGIFDKTYTHASERYNQKDILRSHYDKGVLFGYLEVCRKINDLIEQGALNVREPFGPLDPEMFLQVGMLSIVSDTITLQYEGNATYGGG